MAFPFEDWSDREVAELRSIIAAFSSKGRYANLWRAARREMDRRGIDYSDCLSPEELTA